MSAQDPSPRQPRQASPHEAAGFGLVFAAVGLYFMLVATGVLPSPQGSAHSPMAIVFCAGVAFLFAGLTCVVRALAGMTDNQSDVPDSAARWAQLSYRVLGIGAAGALAAIGTWIAIGSGPRAFNISGPFIEMRTTGEIVGRTVFGLGAVLVWFYVIALTVSTVRKFFGRDAGNNVSPSP